MKVWLKTLVLALCLSMILAATTALGTAHAASGKKSKNITKSCEIIVSEGSARKMLDTSFKSVWEYEHRGAWVAVSIPAKKSAGYLLIEWQFEPTGFELTEYDAQKTSLRTRTLADTFPCIQMVMPLLAETKYVQLTMTAMSQNICTLRVYSAGEAPSELHEWLPPEEKVDMMVVSAHQDDEVVFLGGTIPYSDVVCGRPTITVYMANCTRLRRGEALDCLWAMGTRHYPEFINLQDRNVKSVEAGIELWGGRKNVIGELVTRIRRYKPEVIVTHDFEGEYGHNQHKITAQLMPYAVDAAADPTQYAESYKQYGAWQVKKLYIHLFKENEIRMDWTSPQEKLGGKSLLKVARIGMSKQESQTKYYSVKNGGKYDNARFGLCMTTVGVDVEKNDFFEHIPQTASADYLRENGGNVAAATAEEAFREAAESELPEEPVVTEDESISYDAEDSVPFDGASTSEPAQEDGLEPAEDENAPADSQPPEVSTPPAHENGGSALPAVLLAVSGVAAAGAGGWALRRRSRRRRHRRWYRS